MNFIKFKSSDPVKAAFRRMGLSQYLNAAQDWHELRSLIVDYNDCDAGRFVNVARRYDSECSSGERVLLHAILYVTDFPWLADELDKGCTWRRINMVSGEHRRAVCACIAAID